MASCIIRRPAKSVCYAGVAFMLVVVLLAGCKRSTTAVEPKGQKPARVQNGGEEIEYTGMNGEDVRYAGGDKAVALPANLPSDVPIYSKATPLMVATSDKETRVILSTTDPLKKVKEFYEEKLKKDGWQLAATTDIAKISMLERRKDHRKLVVLLIRDATDKTSIQIKLSKEE
jgi:hypothetical protein